MVDAFHEGLAARQGTCSGSSPKGTARVDTRPALREGAAVAAGLTRLGVRPGARIALHVPNWPEAMTALYAAMLLRAVVVPIPAIYGPTEVRFILEDARVDTYMLADRWRNQSLPGQPAAGQRVPPAWSG